MTVLGPLMALVIGAQAAHWFGVNRGFTKARRAARNFGGGGGVLPPLSVIVAARNEESQLSHTIEALLAQDYPDYEILIVDDHSRDSTAELVRSWMQKDGRLRLIESEGSGKKAAVASGIAAARHDVCVFTDADCRPSPMWLSRHGRFYRDGKQTVVVGYAPLRTQGGLLGLYQRFDTELNQMFAAASIGNLRAYMATGRNFSYSKQLFYAVDGFERHSAVLSGDDDILLQDFRTRTDARIIWCDDDDIVVQSDAKRDLVTWFQQKRRHTSAGRYFVRDVKISQALYHVSHLFLWVVSLFAGSSGVALILVWLLFQWFFMRDAHARLGRRFSLAWLPLLGALQALYTLVIPVTGLIKRPSNW